MSTVITSIDRRSPADRYGIKVGEKLLTINCFGTFEVLHNGEILAFGRKKAKELMAILVDRKGAGMTASRPPTWVIIAEGLIFPASMSFRLSIMSSVLPPLVPTM